MKQAQSVLMTNVNSQAFIEGVNDDFLLAAIISVVGLVPIMFLRTKKNGLQPQSEPKAHLEIIE
jgi:DHA2 family multidrug resistance protein